MAIFRKVHVTFWEDPFIQSLTPEKKYFYLYLLTNSKTTQCGIYEISHTKIQNDTGYNQETVGKLIDYFVKNKRIQYSKNTNEIAIKNWPKYNGSESPKVEACIRKELKQVKNRVLIEYLYSMDTHPQEEQEEDTEQEKEKYSEQEPEILVWPSFEDFWNLYDKKEDRLKCEKKWKKINQEAREKIMLHVEDYVKVTTDKQYRKNPATYLGNESWNNELIVKQNGKPIFNPSESAKRIDEMLRAREDN